MVLDGWFFAGDRCQQPQAFHRVVIPDPDTVMVLGLHMREATEQIHIDAVEDRGVSFAAVFLGYTTSHKGTHSDQGIGRLDELSFPFQSRVAGDQAFQRQLGADDHRAALRRGQANVFRKLRFPGGCLDDIVGNHSQGGVHLLRVSDFIFERREGMNGDATLQASFFTGCRGEQRDVGTELGKRGGQIGIKGAEATAFSMARNVFLAEHDAHQQGHPYV